MIDFVKKSVTIAFAIITCTFTFVPEALFKKHEWITKEALEQCKWFAGLESPDVNVIISRLMYFLLVWIVTLSVYAAFLKLRRKITINLNR